MTIHRNFSVATLLVFLTGCAVGHRTVDFDPLTPTIAVTGDTIGTFFIDSVSDHRAFQNKPRDPSVPSIDGDVEEMTEDLRIRMIGRQRNTYGQALGDVALPEGDSILVRTKHLLGRGLAAHGYQLIEDEDAPVMASIVIDKFWAWISPGFWSIKTEAEVELTVTLRRGEQEYTVSAAGYAIKGTSTAVTGETWEVVYELAFEDFLKNLDTELSKIGF